MLAVLEKIAVNDLLIHQAAVLDAHARYSMWKRELDAHNLRGAVISNELQSAKAELDVLASNAPEIEVLR